MLFHDSAHCDVITRVLTLDLIGEGLQVSKVSLCNIFVILHHLAQYSGTDIEIYKQNANGHLIMCLQCCDWIEGWCQKLLTYYSKITSYLICLYTQFCFVNNYILRITVEYKCLTFVWQSLIFPTKPPRFSRKKGPYFFTISRGGLQQEAWFLVRRVLPTALFLKTRPWVGQGLT